MVGNTYQMNSRYFLKLVKFCSNTSHHIHQSKMVSLKHKNWTLVESTCIMLQSTSLKNSLWNEVVAIACYLQNISYIFVIKGNTPFEIWTGSKPDIQHLQIFRVPTYEHLPKELQKKLDPKSNKCIFIGYGQIEGVKGYWLYNIITKKVSISRNVTFDENVVFPPTKGKNVEGATTLKDNSSQQQ